MTGDGKLPQISKQCPQCGNGVLRIKTNSETGVLFLGCSNYFELNQDGEPRCKWTEPVPTYARMIQLGAEQLPGFDL